MGESLKESVLEYLRQLGSNVRKVYDLLVHPDYGLEQIKDAVDNIQIDTTDLAKEDTLTQGISTILEAIENIQPGSEIDPIPDDFIEGLFDENTEIENKNNGE